MIFCVLAMFAVQNKMEQKFVFFAKNNIIMMLYLSDLVLCSFFSVPETNKTHKNTETILRIGK